MAGIAILTAACGEEAGAQRVCVPYETQACFGPGACNGGQMCRANGSGWTTCDCGENAARSQLDGEANKPVNDQIPEIEFPDPDPATFDTVSDALLLSRQELVLVFHDDVTLNEANGLLKELNAEVVGAMSDCGVLLLRLPDSPDTTNIVQVREEIQDDPRVDSVMVCDAFLEEQRLPPRPTESSEWSWPVHPDGTGTGAWGLEVARFPQIWNLREWLVEVDAAPNVAVVDSGFDLSHPDIGSVSSAFSAQTIPEPLPIRDHGTGVTGVMSADWTNGSAVEGAISFLPGARVQVAKSFKNTAQDWWGGLPSPMANSIPTHSNLWRLHELTRQPSPPVAVNNSYGMNYVSRGCLDPENDTVGQSGFPWNAHIWLWANLFDRVLSTPAGRRIVWVASAGNDGRRAFHGCSHAHNYKATENSPLAFLAKESGGQFLSVGAKDSSGSVTTFSNVDASIDAAGQCVLGLQVAGDGDDANDRDRCSSSNDPDLALWTGTSFSAPFVTAAAGLVFAIKPSLGADQVGTTLKTTASEKWGLDAFAAMMSAATEGNFWSASIMTALVDVDDGTLDGNRTDCGAVGQPCFRGDGSIGMADFRVYRDALLQLEGSVDSVPIELQGVPFRDLNGNGVLEHVRPTENWISIENRYPRMDFNGDGILLTADGKRTGTPRDRGYTHPPELADMTDLDVLSQLWPSDTVETEGVESGSLEGLLRSGDVEVHVHGLGAQGALQTEVTVSVGGQVPTHARDVLIAWNTECDLPDDSSPCALITVPPGTATVSAVAIHTDGTREELDTQERTVTPGLDVTVTFELCPPEHPWNESTSSCECPSETPIWDGNRCQPCSPGTTWNGSTCAPESAPTGAQAYAGTAATCAFCSSGDCSSYPTTCADVPLVLFFDETGVVTWAGPGLAPIIDSTRNGDQFSVTLSSLAGPELGTVEIVGTVSEDRVTGTISTVMDFSDLLGYVVTEEGDFTLTPISEPACDNMCATVSALNCQGWSPSDCAGGCIVAVETGRQLGCGTEFAAAYQCLGDEPASSFECGADGPAPSDAACAQERAAAAACAE